MKPMLFNTDMVKAILAGKKTVTRRVIKPATLCGEALPATEKFFVSHSTGAVYWEKSLRVLLVDGKPVVAPYKPHDVLYVRETWKVQSAHRYEADARIMFKAGGQMSKIQFSGRCSDSHERHDYDNFIDKWGVDGKWHPSIHMPKEAARIFLKVKDVRVERLQGITAEQAIREGISRMFDHLPDDEYVQWAARVAPGKKKTDWGWDNYLWHGDFGNYGMGNKLSDAWPYQYSGYDEPVGSFSSLWNKTLPLKEWPTYGWEANPWVWVIEFERCERPGAEKEADK